LWLVRLLVNRDRREEALMDHVRLGSDRPRKLAGHRAKFGYWLVDYGRTCRLLGSVSDRGLAKVIEVVEGQHGFDDEPLLPLPLTPRLNDHQRLVFFFARNGDWSGGLWELGMGLARGVGVWRDGRPCHRITRLRTALPFVEVGLIVRVMMVRMARHLGFWRRCFGGPELVFLLAVLSLPACECVCGVPGVCAMCSEGIPCLSCSSGLWSVVTDARSIPAARARCRESGRWPPAQQAGECPGGFTCGASPESGSPAKLGQFPAGRAWVSRRW